MVSKAVKPEVMGVWASSVSTILSSPLLFFTNHVQPEAKFPAARAEKSLLESLEGTPLSLHSLRYRPRGLPPSLWRKAIPVKSVIPYLGSIVKKATIRPLDDVHEGHILVLGSLNGPIELSDVSSVVFTVVKF